MHRAKVLDFIHNTSFSVVSALIKCETPKIFIKAKSNTKKYIKIEMNTPETALKFGQFLH